MQYVPTNLYLYGISYRNEVEYLNKYLGHLDQSVQGHNKEMYGNLQEDIMDVGVENEAALRDVYRDDLYKIPSYYYHSSFLLIYALLESSLQKICEELYVQLNLPIKPKDVSTTNYLSFSLKYIGWFSIISNELKDKGNDFIPYQRLRNLIVHNASTTDQADDKKNRLFAKDITYERGGTFYINNIKFLEVFLNKVDHFIGDILNLLQSLEIIPVAVHDKGIIKYYSLEEFNRFYEPPRKIDLKWSRDLPF